MKAVVLLLLLAGCAAPACRNITFTETKTETVNRYIIVHDGPAHAVLLSDYAQTLSQERHLVAHAKAPTIDRLLQLDEAAREAFAPVQNPYHKATPAEIKRAIEALGALQVYVISQKH
jgi:hypothetical protein